jgi:hypothetical protein
VTDRHVPDAELREAFQSLGHTADDPSPADLDLIWRAVTGELPSPERRNLVDRMGAIRPSRGLARRSRGSIVKRRRHLAPTSPSRPILEPMVDVCAAGLLIAVTAGLVFRADGSHRRGNIPRLRRLQRRFSRPLPDLSPA